MALKRLKTTIRLTNRCEDDQVYQKIQFMDMLTVIYKEWSASTIFMHLPHVHFSTLSKATACTPQLLTLELQLLLLRVLFCPATCQLPCLQYLPIPSSRLVRHVFFHIYKKLHPHFLQTSNNSTNSDDPI